MIKIYPNELFIKNVDDMIKVIVALENRRNKSLDIDKDYTQELLSAKPFCYVTTLIINTFLLNHKRILIPGKELFVLFEQMTPDVYKVMIDEIIDIED